MSNFLDYNLRTSGPQTRCTKTRSSFRAPTGLHFWSNESREMRVSKINRYANVEITWHKHERYQDTGVNCNSVCQLNASLRRSIRGWSVSYPWRWRYNVDNFIPVPRESNQCRYAWPYKNT